VNPDAWILTAHGWVGSNPSDVVAVVDARIVLDNARTALVRRRSWQ
jgi:hypothetical protein